MFAYCNNNPVNFSDASGCFALDASITFREFECIFASLAGLSVVDGPLPVGDILGITVALLLTIETLDKQYMPIYMDSIYEQEEKEEEILGLTYSGPKRTVIFPMDPNDFQPVGLNKVVRSGKKWDAY